MHPSQNGDSLPAGRFRRSLIASALTLWAGAVGTGMFLLSAYAGTPGESPASSENAPTLAPSPDFRFLMFAHPRCPCTASSVRELSRILADCDERAQAVVYFYRPADADDAWAQTMLWETAATIPGVRVAADPDGETAANFGSNVSGEVFLFGPEGRLRFRGGVTPARGHEGDSVGKLAAIAIVKGERDDAGVSPAFGCALRPASARNDD